MIYANCSLNQGKRVQLLSRNGVSPVGWVKCNVDGAFDVDQGQGATGVVLRDHTRTYKGGRARWHQHGLNALSMEAEACRDGMILAGELNVRQLQVETDNQELLKLWEM